MNSINVPVALFFFTRPEPLKKVFDQIRIARPNKLFLIQDGERINKDDINNILACRNVVSEIDWPCDVYENYSDINLGVGKRISSGIKWAFEHVDRLVILEDDCVPSQSFFSFTSELLEKYRFDERINMISGMNHLNEYDPLGNSYFFCKSGSIWGWATWKRVWDNYDYEMGFYNENGIMSQVSGACYPNSTAKSLLSRGENVYSKIKNNEKLSAWTYQFRMIRHLQSQVVIVPSKNLISNIGITEDTTHATNSLKKMPKGIRRVFFMRAHEINYPLKHPKYVMEDSWYDRQVKFILGEYSHIRLYRKIESIIRRIIFR